MVADRSARSGGDGGRALCALSQWVIGCGPGTSLRERIAGPESLPAALADPVLIDRAAAATVLE
jgi:hypothetical protein